MARLPNDPFFGAAYTDVPDAPSFNEGATTSNVGRQADATELERQKKALAALDEVRREAAVQVARVDLRLELEEATDLNGLREAEQRFEATRAANAKSLFADPEMGGQWLQAGDRVARRLIDVRAADLTRNQEVGRLDGTLDALRNSALQVSGPEAAKLLDAGANLIGGAQGAGLLDATTAEVKRQRLVHSYATAWIEKRSRSPEERLALLDESAFQTGQLAEDKAPGAIRRTGTPADFVPPEDRDRIRREAQVEIDRSRTQLLWQQSRLYAQSIEQSLHGAAQPPKRAAIETDPHLDELTRTRLLQKHAAMEAELAAYAQFKALFDNPESGLFNTDDAIIRRFADKTYQRLGATPAALHAVASRTGILPDSALARIQGDAASDVPARLTQAVTQIAQLRRDHPKLLAFGSADVDDLQYTETQFREYLKQGETPDQAFQHIVRVRSSEAQVALASRLKRIDVDTTVANATSTFDLDPAFVGDPASTVAMYTAYPELVKERFVATGDLALAKAQAREQFQLLARAVDEDGDAGHGSGNGGGGDDTPNETVDPGPPETRPTMRLTVRPRWVVLPESSQPDGPGKPDTSRQAAAPASENAEAPRSNAPADEPEAITPQSAPAIGPPILPSPAQRQPNPQPSPGPSAPSDSEVPAPAQPAPQPAASSVSLQERQDLTEANAEFRNTIQGAAKLNQWATTKLWLGANPNATDQQLLAQFTPALLRARWAERRQAMASYLRDAPRLYDDARGKLERYDAMPSARTAAEFAASARGEVRVAVKSPENLIGGGSVNGGTLLLRAFKAALWQAGSAAASDAIIQWQNIESGVQEKFDGWRTAISAGFAGLFGVGMDAGGNAIRTGIKRKLAASARKKAAAAGYRATVGHASSKSYRKTFFRANPTLKGKVVVHHAIERKVLKKYAGLFTVEEMHSLQNLRGIPKELNSELHLRTLRREWNDFYREHAVPTRQQLLDKATEIDKRYGHLFKPPVGQ